MTRAGLRWDSWSLTVKGSAIILASLSMLLGSVATSYTLERQTADATAEMLRTLQVQRDIESLQSLVAEAATGVRGYLLTGVDDFLDPYRAAELQLPGAMARLQKNIRDPEQRERLQLLLPFVRLKLADLDVLRRRYNNDPENLRASLSSGRQILNELRDGIGAMNARESLLVEQRTAAVQAALRRNVLMNAATILVGLAGALAMLLFTLRVVRRVRLATENAERLVNDQPLTAPGVASDELGLLADRLHQASLLLANRATAAHAASLAKTQFMSRTSHELRTPLNAILGFAQLLATTEIAGSQDQQYVGQILRAGKHLLSLINDMLDVARIEAGQLAITSTPVLVAPVLMEALALLTPLASEYGVRLLAPCDCATLTVQADRQRFTQIVLNLLSNAIKYNAVQGQVRIKTLARDDLVAIAFEDDGAGIAVEMQDRLFTPFDRLGAERGTTEGVGLGLAVSRALAEVMGGSIAASSAPGEGSVFTLFLPRSAQPGQKVVPVPPAKSPGIEAPNKPSRTVLCIDSDGSSLALIETLMMRRTHWHLLTAPGASEGLALARQHAPDILLLAQDAADQETLEALRNDATLAGLPLVMLRAGAHSHTTPAVGYLKSPLNVPEFFELLDRILQ
ncbi:ATP-binding protein [Massilia sp. TSP1-1-2]|uniref:ATP-binding protein n=1 Tax=unclassified Massilia TaxID=2609279 RepID=UPI003CF4D7BB